MIKVLSEINYFSNHELILSFKSYDIFISEYFKEFLTEFYQKKGLITISSRPFYDWVKPSSIVMAPNSIIKISLGQTLYWIKAEECQIAFSWNKMSIGK